MTLHVVILGATSAIAEATARVYAADGARLLLVGRRRERLDAIADNLSLCGASEVLVHEADFAKSDPEADFALMAERFGRIDHVLIAWGVMFDQKAAEADLSLAAEMIDVNFRATTLWLLSAAKRLEAQGSGTLIALGSPAGDRGRRYNFIYGAGKAGVATLMEGLSHRFAAKNSDLRAVLVKPMPTDTPMTVTHKKGGPLWTTPQRIAPMIKRAAERGQPVAYVPFRGRIIMTIIRALPRFIFNKMDI